MRTVAPRTAGLVVATAALVASTVVAAAPASAAPVVISIEYDASGTTLVTKPNSTVALGPSVLRTDLANDGSFTGSLPLPPATTQFTVLGLLPVKGTVSFVPAGDVVGRLVTQGRRSAVTATASYTIKLSNVTLGGLPAFVGSRCQTAAPVRIPIATPDDQSFDIYRGGTVEGTYSIGKFRNCGLDTGLINLIVPGPGNTVGFTLSNGRVAS